MLLKERSRIKIRLKYHTVNVVIKCVLSDIFGLRRCWEISRFGFAGSEMCEGKGGHEQKNKG